MVVFCWQGLFVFEIGYVGKLMKLYKKEPAAPFREAAGSWGEGVRFVDDPGLFALHHRGDVAFDRVDGLDVEVFDQDVEHRRREESRDGGS